MNINKKTAFTSFVTICLSVSGAMAYAEKAVNSTAPSINATIVHIEKALVDINKSDFFAANLDLKAARSSSEQIIGDEAIVKQAGASVIQGQLRSKEGDIKKASDELNKALMLYKSL